MVLADPPALEDGVLKTTLTLQFTGFGGTFDWSGPYYDRWVWDDGTRHANPELEVNVVDYKVETTAAMTQHSIEIQWPLFLATGLLFRSAGGGCDLPALVCTADGCALGP